VVLRALVLALALPLMSSGALPFWAQLVGVEGPHVCHCSVEQHDCVCPKCNPDHEDRLGSESLKGRCGDDELAFAGKALRAVLPAPSILGPMVVVVPREREAFPIFDTFTVPPPTPPPRSSTPAV
jgi:hypothetical protein